MGNKTIHIYQPKKNEMELFFSESKAESACIGHLRIDFGSGDEFWHSWWGEHEEMNDTVFSDTLDHLFRTMRKNIFKDRDSMKAYLKKLPTEQIDDWHGFKAECNGSSILKEDENNGQLQTVRQPHPQAGLK